MIKKVFILGLPGSGKSAVARYIDSYIKEKPVPETGKYWLSTRFNDYSILDEMSKHPTEGELFNRPESGGFDVVDIRAFDVALQRLEKRIADSLSFPEASKSEMLVIEFARNDYKRAFDQFKEDFIRDAYFIYLGADVEVCKQRIRDRIVDVVHDDDYHVSEYIFEKYYHSDDGQELPHFLKQDYEIDESRVLLIDNNHSLDIAIERITTFIDRIIVSVLARESDM